MGSLTGEDIKSRSPSRSTNALLRIIGPDFVAGAEIGPRAHRVVRCAPKLRVLIFGQGRTQVAALIKARGWSAMILRPGADAWESWP